jgi:fatty-acyl-CoA synthase
MAIIMDSRGGQARALPICDRSGDIGEWHTGGDTMGKLGITTTYQDIESLAVGEALQRSAHIAPDKVCISFKGERITYRELHEQSNFLAAGLQDIGIRKGDRVSIYMSNCPELYVAFYALQKVGAIVAWANPAYRTQELTFILNNSQAKAIFVQKGKNGFDNFGLVHELRGNLLHLSYVITIGGGDGEGVFAFEDVLSRGKKKGLTKPLIDIHQDLSMLIYTSGTTGVPKGSMITQFQAVRGGYSHVGGVEATADDIFVGILPLTHSFGCGTTLIQPILIQASVILLEAFSPEEAFKAIDAGKATIQHGAPAHYIMEMNHPNLDRYNLSSLRAGYLAGQICPEEVIQWGEDRNIYLSSSWGNSEVGPGAGTMCPFGTPLEVRKKSVGNPIPGTEVKVIDPDTGKQLGTDEVGEMMVRGPNVLKGYWQNPEETAKQLEKDGWLHTGDLVSVDDKGFIRMYGRSKDLINRGGLKIYPSEIESLILQHPQVEQACVVGTPNPVLGESICACIIPKNRARIPLNEIREFLKDKVAKHKLPDELLIVSDFPKLPGGMKVKKYGAGGVQEMASADQSRERNR